MSNIVKFQDKELHTHDFNGLPGLSSVELAQGLGYADEGAVTRIYNRHADEFTDDMTLVVNLTVKGFGNGNSVKPVRIFSPRGCHLVAMFAHTPFAKAFRKWVLDVLDKKPVANQNSLTQDQAALKAIGGIVKKCVNKAMSDFLSAELPAADDDDVLRQKYYNITDQNMVEMFQRWYWSRNYDVRKIIDSQSQRIEELETKLRMVQKVVC